MGLSTGWVISIVLFVILVVTIGGFFYYIVYKCRRSGHMVVERSPGGPSPGGPSEAPSDPEWDALYSKIMSEPKS